MCVHPVCVLRHQLQPLVVGTCEASRFDSAVRFDSIRKGLANSKIIESAVPASLLIVSLVKRLKPLTALSGTVYRLASSMSDHTPVINVFEDCNEEYVVPHISFASVVTTDFNI